jgi:hypothetical protein
MDSQQLLKLAERIRDGTATKEEKLQFLQALRFELGAASKILSETKKQNSFDEP